MATAQELPSYHADDLLHRGLHDQLTQRRARLESAMSRQASARLTRLLEEVDNALDRLAGGTYGVCKECHESIETERLFADPMACFCLDHLPPEQRRALEADLELAARLQSRLLPPRDFQCSHWSTAYHYQPAGVVSGDFCDLLTGPDNKIYFALGEVSGKGLAASMLMSNLSAMFRALIPLGVGLSALMEHANRVLCDSTLPTQYATLVVGSAGADGAVTICNAGHAPPLWRHDHSVTRVECSGLPIGLFCAQDFDEVKVHLEPGEALVLYTDGISEARNGADAEYGDARLSEAVSRCGSLAPASVVAACIADVNQFRGGAPLFDDQTLLIAKRAGA